MLGSTDVTQQTLTVSKSIKEILEKGMTYAQS